MPLARAPHAAPQAHARPAVLTALGACATMALLTLSQVLAVGALAAMPLGRTALATGVVAAFVAATVGGLLVAAIARAPAEICAPASSIIVIYAALCADLVTRAGPTASLPHVWAALSLAVVLMGLLMALAGWLRLGDAIKFMPAPVSAGFVTGIGLLVIWSQLGPLIGLEGRLSSYHWPDVAARLKPASLAVGALTALVIALWPRITKHGQPALVGLVAGSAIYYALEWIYGAQHLGPTLGGIAPAHAAQSTFTAVWDTVDGAWLASTALVVLPYSAFLALQAVMNGAVTSVAVSDLLGARSNVNRTLAAQGVANVLCGALGALPVCTVASLALPAARMKSAAAVVPAGGAVVVLFAVLLAGGLLSHIPVAVLAGILIMGGLNMTDRWARGLAKRFLLKRGYREAHLTWNLVMVAAVAAAFFFGSVPLALLVGAVLAMILLTVNLSVMTTFGSHDAARFASTRVWASEQAQWLEAARGAVRIFRPRGGLFFGTADELATRLAALEPGVRYCVLDLSRLTTVDSTGCQIVAAGTRKLAARGVTSVLAGLDAAQPREQGLIALGLTHPDPRTQWFPDLDRALEWVETRLIEERWPGLQVDTRVSLADTPLTRGFSAADLEALRACMERIDLPAGPLFHRGDPGTSMFVIDQGFVEIRVRHDEDATATRLAGFGPGSIFGEIAMLTSAERTADAVCIEPTRLYELKRDALMRLERESPRLYARIIENLNAHLANRLAIATANLQANH